MPVRGTTEWEHAILHKKVINHDRGGTYVLCAWDTCEKPGFELHKCVETVGYEPVMWDGKLFRLPRTITYVFCTERHKMYWLYSIRRANDLPAGYKSSIL